MWGPGSDSEFRESPCAWLAAKIIELTVDKQI